MAIGAIHLFFILYNRQFGLDFENTATLGRQSLCLHQRDMLAAFKKFNLDFDEETVKTVFADTSLKDFKIGYCEPLFKAMGAKTVDSIDASGYEDATIVHDLNIAVPAEMENRFSLLVDGGTLEHVFNFPVAIENCMKMVKPGGHFLSVAPANNFIGHGFYQFSPELFFRVFCRENGFQIGKVFLCGEKSNTTWHEIPDPAEIRERVEFSNQVPTFQLFVAQKMSPDAGLHIWPQQSDYSALLWQGGNTGNWTAHGDSRENAKLARGRKITELLSREVADFLKNARQIVHGALTPPFKHRHLRRFKI